MIFIVLKQSFTLKKRDDDFSLYFLMCPNTKSANMVSICTRIGCIDVLSMDK